MSKSSRFMIQPQFMESQVSGNMKEIKFNQAASNEQGNSGSSKLIPNIILPPAPLEARLTPGDMNSKNT